MSKGYSLKRINCAIMKADAQADYNVVVMVCKALSLPVIEPEGKSAWKIEDATAEMIKAIPPVQKLQLRKGLSYYVSLNK